MAKKHGLTGLFGGDTDSNGKDVPLPPVVDDPDASPFERLAQKLALDDPFDAPDVETHHDPFGRSVPAEPPVLAEPPAKPEPAPEPPVARAEPAPEPAKPAPQPEPEPAPQPAFAAAAARAMPEIIEPQREPAPRPVEAYAPAPAPAGKPAFKRVRAPLKNRAAVPDKGILCFILEGGDERLRRRTLEALNEAAGIHGSISLRALPREREAMNQALSEAMAETDCEYVAFFHPGTEPADDWTIEVLLAFEDQPNVGAVSVRAANSDPLSPWARVSFFIDEAERQKGVARGFDTIVFRASALKDLDDKIGVAVRSGAVVHAISGQGQRIGSAPEARVKLATPTGRKEVMQHVREQARIAARIKAQGKNPVLRIFSALFIVFGYPFRILAVRAAAKKAVGASQFREVASKAAMAVFADRRVRALTTLSPGKAE
ncbi:MAG: glycosyltransferase family 2 protein [Pseudomonadota bacterium]